MKCTKCQNEIPDNSMMCSFCGNIINENTDPNKTEILFTEDEIKNTLNSAKEPKKKESSNTKKSIIVVVSVLLILAVMGTVVYFLIGKEEYKSPENNYSETKVSVGGYSFTISNYYTYEVINDGDYLEINSDSEKYYAYFAPLKDAYESTPEYYAKLKNKLTSEGMEIVSSKNYTSSSKRYTVISGTLKNRYVSVVYTKLGENSLVGYIILDDDSSIDDSFDNVLTDFNDIIINTKTSTKTSTTLSLESKVPDSLENTLE